MAGCIQITPLGDSALIVRLRENPEDASLDPLDAVLSLLASIKRAEIPGVIELAAAYTTVAVFFDPLAVMAQGVPPEGVLQWLAQRVETAAARHAATRTSPSLVEIPVCYDETFALDLDEVSKHAGLSPQAVVDLHSGAKYRVDCLGFTPGFPYLSGLPPVLATPRRPVPRKEVPAGSVAIGGGQTGVYPTRSPGGWNVIGRTPLRLFDPKKFPPTLLHVGDCVRFRSITRDELGALSQ
jgi:inhibitor of KinA